MGFLKQRRCFLRGGFLGGLGAPCPLQALRCRGVYVCVISWHMWAVGCQVFALCGRLCFRKRRFLRIDPLNGSSECESACLGCLPLTLDQAQRAVSQGQEKEVSCRTKRWQQDLVSSGSLWFSFNFPSSVLHQPSKRPQHMQWQGVPEAHSVLPSLCPFQISCQLDAQPGSKIQREAEKRPRNEGTLAKEMLPEEAGGDWGQLA